MGGTEEVEQKHKIDEGKEEEVKDKKKKDKKKEKDENDPEGNKEKKDKKKKNPEDKNDPTKLKQKLEKIDIKMRDLAIKREEILKAIEEAGNSAAPNANEQDQSTLKQE